MPRIRSTKPEFWSSGQVMECSRNARLLFLGLWNFCDDKGRHTWKPKQCRAEVFPGDDDLSDNDVLNMLTELVDNGLIARYEVDGQEYFYVTGWSHQRIDKPQKAKYPPPFQECYENDMGTFPPDTIGKDRIGKDSVEDPPPDGGNEVKHRSKIDPDMPLTDHMRELAVNYWRQRHRPDLDPDDEFSHFVAHHIAKGTKMENWEKAWQTWYCNSMKLTRPQAQVQVPRSMRG